MLGCPRVAEEGMDRHGLPTETLCPAGTFLWDTAWLCRKFAFLRQNPKAHIGGSYWIPGS
jgi:hypothetical protein